MTIVLQDTFLGPKKSIYEGHLVSIRAHNLQD